MADTGAVSIIIPVLNEAEVLEESLQKLFEIPSVAESCEVIVCDGGSEDGTLEIASKFPCTCLQSSPGRAQQMNHGAASSNAPVLLFLHADSYLPTHFIHSLSHDWGFFPVRLSGTTFVFRIIETFINLRTRLTRVAGGDQGLFFRRPFFEDIGGFPEIPLMEDIAISKRARQLKPPGISDQKILTSSRRWQKHGVIRTVLLMWSLRFAYWRGSDPEQLHKRYYQQSQ
ncbi:MAG: TIGR04283 family arsenosugar biosynthesis glycosyltransferase [Pseudomonadota bacterium]